MVMELTLILRNATPMLTGWYDPKKVDYMGLRTTEVKGLWRWWARAFVGGALYDAGLLRGHQVGDVLLKPTSHEVLCISKFVGSILGLGLALREESIASKFRLYVEPLEVKTVQSRELSVWRRAQRINLLTIKEDVEAIEPGKTFTIHIELLKKFEYVETVLKILAVALQLVGIGKGSRRGLGSLDILSFKGDTSTLRVFEESLRGREGLRTLVKEAYSECAEIVSKNIGNVRECMSRGGHPEDLPPIPVVSKEKVFGVPVTNIKVYPGVTEGLFVRVHDFFIRSERCRTLYGTPKCDDELRRDFHAWFLGLPRSQRGTGYFAKVVRRSSPIHLTLHSNGNRFGGGAFVAVLLSGDWPNKIEWFGKRKTSIDITSQRVIEAYTTFEREFHNYMSRIGAGEGVVIWP